MLTTSQPLLLTNATLYTPEGVIKDGWIFIENGLITAMGNGTKPQCTQVIDLQGNSLLPGFIDLHVHGALGKSVMEATPNALHTMARHFARSGVTGFLAATLTASQEKITAAITNIAACMGPIEGGARLLGAYLEGPYINEEAKGAHNHEYIRRADPAEYKTWFEPGALKIVTVAPESPENMQLIRDCVQSNIMPSIGHTRADYHQTNTAIAHGAHHTTHLFNAMTGIHHRSPGTVGALLTNDAVTCELIADGIHLHPAIVQLAIRTKGTDNVLLVTDGEVGMGMIPGCYDFSGHHVQVTHEAVYLPEGTLAGSILTMDKALRNTMSAASLSLEQAWPMTSRNAARQLGLEHRKGILRVGYDADIVVLDKDDYSVQMTIGEGKMLYTNPSKSETHERTINPNTHHQHTPHLPTFIDPQNP